MLPIVLLAFTLQAPGELTEGDVPQILDAVTWHFRSQHTGRTPALPGFVKTDGASASRLSLNLPRESRVPVFVDGEKAARAAREVVPSMQATLSDSGQSYRARARDDVVRCSDDADCAIDGGGIFLTTEHIGLLPGRIAGAEEVWVRLLVESNDLRHPGSIRRRETTVAVVREDGEWRARGEFSLEFEYLCAR